MSKRARGMIAGGAILVLLLLVAVLLRDTEPLKALLDGFGSEADDCVVYHRFDFDTHKGHFRPAAGSQLELSNDSCGGKALRIRRARPEGDFGAYVSLFLEGTERLKIAYLCKANGVPWARLNLWDKLAQDNITPKGYRALSADTWSPVLYHVEDFRYNASSDLHSRLGEQSFLQNLFLYGEQEVSPDTWMLVDNLAIYRGQDRTPPGRVERVEAAPTAGGVRLSWAPARDNVGVMLYLITRADGPAGAFHKIAETSVPSWLDRVPGPGDYRYRVLACDFEENRGDWSDVIEVRYSDSFGSR